MARRAVSRITGLSMQQMIFCEKYVALGPLGLAVKAAAYAKYSHPNEAAYKLLNQKAVTDYIEKLRLETRLRNNITVDDLLAEYMKIAFADIRELYDDNGDMLPVNQLSDHVAAAIMDIDIETTTSVFEQEKTTIKLRRYNKLTALEAIRELLGFKQRQVTVERDAEGKIIKTSETLTEAQHKVIFEDNGETIDADGDL